MDKEKKTGIVKGFARHEKDTGSSEVQVAIQTHRIRELTEHLKVHRHDEHSRRGLLQLVGKRRRQLAYLARRKSQSYLALIEKLGLKR